jgi:hypothetical protein
MPKKVPVMFQPVSVDDIVTAHRVIDETYQNEGGERSMERTCIILAQHFKRKDHVVMRIMTRMHALSHLWEDRRMRRWKIDGGPDGPSLMEEPALRALAEEPFVRRDNDWKFDPDKFFERVLREAEHDGQG